MPQTAKGRGNNDERSIRYAGLYKKTEVIFLLGFYMSFGISAERFAKYSTFKKTTKNISQSYPIVNHKKLCARSKRNTHKSTATGAATYSWSPHHREKDLLQPSQVYNTPTTDERIPQTNL